MAFQFGNHKKMRDSDFESSHDSRIREQKCDPDCPVCKGTGEIEIQIGGSCSKLKCRRCFPSSGIVEK